MTTSQKFNGSSTDTITSTMAARRDVIALEEIERGNELESQGVPNALIQAHIETIFGIKDAKPSPTPEPCKNPYAKWEAIQKAAAGLTL